MKKDDLIDKIKEFILGGLDSDEDGAPANNANNNQNNQNNNHEQEEDEEPSQPSQQNKKQKVEAKVQQQDDDTDDEAGSNAAGKQPDADTRPWCQYGASCYRKNPVHFKEFRHPDRD